MPLPLIGLPPARRRDALDTVPELVGWGEEKRDVEKEGRDAKEVRGAVKDGRAAEKDGLGAANDA